MRKSEINIAVCHARQGFVVRGGFGAVRLDVAAGDELSGFLRSSEPDRLSRTRRTTPSRSDDDDDRNRALLSGRQAEEDLLCLAVRHAIRQKVVGRTRKIKSERKRDDERKILRRKGRDRQLEVAERAQEGGRERI